MQLYDKYVASIESLLSSFPFQSQTGDKILPWPLDEETEIVFSSDAALELGGDFGMSVSLATSSKYVKQDEVVVYGDDLKDIFSFKGYARIVLVSVKDELMGEGNTLFQSIRKIDYVRYHVAPKGYMMMIAPISHKENVRVSKQSYKDGISFNSVGKDFIEAYRTLPFVEAVKVIFICKKDFDYKKLEEIIIESEGVTKALDHLSNKVKMDCHSCSLQKVCNEVEGLMKEDFKKKGK